MESNATPLDKVAAVRAWMQTNQVAAYVVMTADPHQNEYLPDYYLSREWLTGFTGSAGTAVLTLTDALLWTDSRYWLQAEEELKGGPFRLMKEGDAGTLSVDEYLRQEVLTAGARIGFAPYAIPLADAQQWQQAGFELSPYDVIDHLWTDRPALPHAPIYEQSAAFTALMRAEKLAELKAYVEAHVTDEECLIGNLSDIAWLLNLRGLDIAYNPVFLAYLRYNRRDEQFTLYTHCSTLEPDVVAALSHDGVALRPYEAIEEDLTNARSVTGSSQLPYALGAYLTTQSDALGDWLAHRRSVKDAHEVEGFREAMKRDGVALVRFLCWLDHEISAGHALTECGVDEQLTALRAEGAGYEQLSFATIAAYGPHGAIVHYEPTEQTDAPLQPKSLLLLDSGAQYDSGTTDITRTIALGPLTEEERKVYTLVLKGHLALQRLRFPKGTNGLQLDLAARMAMWHEGYDFGHGTGHGVGAHLCVHEGPQQIRKDKRACTMIPFEPGMIITDEPGIYVTGKFGVRIENMLCCVPHATTDFGEFYAFEPLTLCPYDLRPVDRSALTPEEVAQINDYHDLVKRTLLPLIDEDDVKAWLLHATQPIFLDL